MGFTVESPWQHRDALGESPIWDPDTRTLIRVDCERGFLIWLDVESGDQIIHDMGDEVGYAAFAKSGEALVTVGQSLVAVAKDGTRRTISSSIDQRFGESGRYNDGKCDPHGRMFAGTLDKTFSGQGGFYRFDDAGRAQKLFGGVNVSNGLDWDVERKLMYWTDSIDYRIDAFDYDGETGEISGRRPFVHFDKSEGMPDGMTLDAEGGLWVAMFQGSAIRRYAPDGSLSAVVEVPTSCPTSIIIGGLDGKTAFVTSSYSWLKDDEKLNQPMGGGVLTFDAGVQGVVPGRVEI
ncbi:SMP-30/gluconolactonase/LRE family protein [Rhodococcus sp. NPDC057529]|uniref:SMP-30/gluconolactonase/LRE family protein n=1 Tax=Rhodococcus sp. NPDC057529 TaxID=3346158 RepID=UPI00367178E7